MDLEQDNGSVVVDNEGIEIGSRWRLFIRYEFAISASVDKFIKLRLRPPFNETPAVHALDLIRVMTGRRLLKPSGTARACAFLLHE